MKITIFVLIISTITYINSRAQSIVESDFCNINNTYSNHANIHKDRLNIFLFSKYGKKGNDGSIRKNYIIGGGNTLGGNSNSGIGVIGELSSETYMSIFSTKVVFSQGIIFNKSKNIEHHLSIGLSTGMTQYSFDASKSFNYLNLSKKNIRLLSDKYENKSYFNFGLSLDYTLQDLYISTSIYNILDENIKKDFDIGLIKERLSFRSTILYDFLINSRLKLTPCIEYLRYVDYSNLYKTQMKATIDESLSVMVGYKTDTDNGALSFSVTYQEKAYSIGYSYEHDNTLQQKNWATHSIYISQTLSHIDYGEEFYEDYYQEELENLDFLVGESETDEQEYDELNDMYDVDDNMVESYDYVNMDTQLDDEDSEQDDEEMEEHLFEKNNEHRTVSRDDKIVYVKPTKRETSKDTQNNSISDSKRVHLIGYNLKSIH